MSCWYGGVLRLVRTLFVAAFGVTSLSACVGTDPQARLRAGSGVSLASTASLKPEAVEPAQPLTAIMPGDLLLQPGRGTAGIDPQAIFARSGNRVARDTALPQRVMTHAAPIAGVPVSGGMAASSTRPRTSPFLAARLNPADTQEGPLPAVQPALTPLADVEARAEVEQRAQASRNRRFDAQVRRASSIVCSGCVPTAGRRLTQTESSSSKTAD